MEYAATFASRETPSSRTSLPAGQPRKEPASELTGKRVVIVEDEGITLLQLSRILRLYGLNVVGTVTDGEEAIHTVLATRPDLVLMDIRMPGLNRLEAAGRILAEYRVCIVMLTAFSEEESRKRRKS